MEASTYKICLTVGLHLKCKIFFTSKRLAVGKGQFHEAERSQKNIPALHLLVYIASKISLLKRVSVETFWFF